MRKKTRLSFSSVSIEAKKENKTPSKPYNSGHSNIEHKNQERKKLTKSSTYQYSKFGKGQNRRSGHTFNSKNQSNNQNENKVPKLEFH